MPAEKNRKFHNNRTTQSTIVIMTNCGDDWGGSEELWARSIPHLQEDGFNIVVIKDKINKQHSRYIELAKKGVVLKDLDIRSRQNQSKRLLLKMWSKVKGSKKNHLQARFEYYLQSFQPQLVVISQGINFDGLLYAYSCFVRQIPYVIVSQKAVEFYWPNLFDRDFMIKAFQNAKACFFVSRQNQELTEEQFGFRFENAQLIQNPVTSPLEIIPYPSQSSVFKLACIGRLFIIDKGQDILLRILAKQKWKERKIHVSFIGTGVDEQGLKAMAELLNVTNVSFCGYVTDMQAVWQDHHALLLPSRSEGMPLVVLEAMAAGRTIIATKAGGTEKFIENEKTGFIGEATTESFEAAMELAWQKRYEWEIIGRKAFNNIKSKMTQLPEVKFADVLTKLIYES